MNSRLKELATRVRKGVKLLDAKIPNWRRTIREHKDQFDFEEGECCVLGTLEAYNGRMRVLKARRSVTDREYTGARIALGIDNGAHYGFDGQIPLGGPVETANASYDRDIEYLDALWRAEIGL